MRPTYRYSYILMTLFVLLSTISSSSSFRVPGAKLSQKKLSYLTSCANVCHLERTSSSSFFGGYDALPSADLLLQVNVSLSAASAGYKNSFVYPMLTSAGNVSTYLDQDHTVPSTSFVAGSIVYAKGEGWPPTANVTVSFLFGEVGEIGLPVTVSTRMIQTDTIGSFACSLKLAANGPPGIWTVYAEFTSNANSSTTFVVYLPTPTPPSLLIPGLIVILLVTAALGLFLYMRRRSDQANYYSTQRRSQK